MKGLKRVTEQGDPGERIPVLVNLVGQVQAARVMGIAPSTINKWLKDNGYKRVVRYEKAQEKVS